MSDSAAVIVGIDLGTSATRLAQTSLARKMPVILRNALSNESTPTLISVPEGGMRLFGEAALGKELSRPKETVSALKQALAADPADAAAVEALNRTGITVNAASDGIVFDLPSVDEPVAPERLLAFYLRHLVAYASAPPTQICFVAPVAAAARYRAALPTALKVAGVDCPAMVVDEAEALVTYMHHLQFADLPEAASEETPAVDVLIINAGESFTSVVAGSLTRASCTVLASEGAAQGTSAVDRVLATKAFAAIKAKHGEDVSTHAKSHNKVQRECKKAKVMLSTTDSVNVQFECLKGDIDHMMKFTGSDLKEATDAAYAGMLTSLVSAAMSKAGFSSGCRVEVVGNGWRSPLATAAIKAATGTERLSNCLDSNMCGAEGAACYGAVMQVAAAAAAGEDTPKDASAEAADPVHTVTVTRADGVAAAPDVAEANIPADTLEFWIASEAAMHAKDEAFREQIAALNDFETVIFSVREDGNEACASDSAAQSKLTTFLEGEENFLYDGRDGLIDGFSTGMILERKAALEAKIEADFPMIAAHRAAKAAEEKRKDEELAKLAAEGAGDKELKSDPQRLRGAQDRREQGVTLFKQEHYAEAQTRFVQALSILAELYDNTGDNKAKKDEISLSCHLNIASCCVKQSLWKIAVSNCTKALEIKPDHPKALYRRGQANVQLHEHEEAIKDLKRALELSNNDPAVKAELDAVEQHVAAAKAKEKKLYSKMFA